MTPNFRNRTLYHGDNLDFLRGINSETIDLVATDPPFNKGRDFHATPDSLASGAKFHDRWSWEKDIEGEWIDQIKTDWPAVSEVIDVANHTWGEDMGAFLCYMGVRLMEMHRLLKPTGSLYLHCDQTAGAYLKMMLDAIFGQHNFRNEIIWAYTGPGNVKRWFPRKHDTLLFYARSDDAKFNRDAVRVPYKGESFTMGGSGSLTRANRQAGDYTTGREEQLAKGKIVEDYWTDIPSLSVSSERVGYPTQKPISLYRRIIDASSDPGDVVLDPFCGCATTLIAAEQAGRQWIGIDLWDEALDVVRTRVEAECQNLFGGAIVYAESPPKRTDDGVIAAPPLKTKKRGAVRPPEPGPVLPRDEMVALLLERQEGKCAGCNRKYDDPLIWEIDHITPRSDGGVNHHSNRCLLCPPCNRIKSNTLTLSGLQKENRKRGRMVSDD